MWRPLLQRLCQLLPHVQAPASRGWGKDALPPPQPEFCKALLTELSARMPSTDQAIYDVVVTHLAPLLVLRHTVELWIDTLGDSRLVDAARNVLLILWPERLCSKVVGVDRGDSDSAKSFVPSIARPVFRSSDACLPVYWYGGAGLYLGPCMGLRRRSCLCP